MLLMQLIVLIIGILCPPELRLAYFTHIFILCLYLFVNKDYKHLTFLAILILTLFFHWLSENNSFHFKSNRLQEINLADLSYQSEQGLSLNITLPPNEELPWYARLYPQNTKLQIALIFPKESEIRLSPYECEQLANKGVKVVASDYKPASRNGDWQQRRLYKENYTGSLTLTLPVWCQGMKDKLPILPSAIGDKVLAKLDQVFSSFHSWRYSRALVLGVNDALSQKEHWQIKNLGLMHLFVVSGLHIGFVYFMVRLLMSLCWPLISFSQSPVLQNQARLTFLLMLPTILFYAYLTGWGESVQRASLMLILWHLFSLSGVKIGSISRLFIVLYCILLIDPRALFSHGLWLSFALVFLLLLFLEVGRKQSLAFLKIQCLLSFCVTALILGWQTSLSSLSVLVNILMLPFVAFIWFPCAFIASLMGYLFDHVWLMNGLDALLSTSLQLLNQLVFDWPLIRLKASADILYKLILFGLCLIWVLYHYQLRVWLTFPLILFALLSPFALGDREERHGVRLIHQENRLTLKGHQHKVLLESAWVNHDSELPLMWLDTYLKPYVKKEWRVFVWPNQEEKLNAAALKRFSPNWLILKQAPSTKLVDLLAAMKVSWLVLEQGDQLKLSFWQERWVLRHSNCLIFLISRQETNCMRVAKLESMLNYSPKF